MLSGEDIHIDDPEYIERSISAPPLSAYSSFQMDTGGVPSRLNPRMPKPIRSSLHDNGDSSHSNEDTSYALNGSGPLDSMDDSHVKHIKSLVIDSKPRTPLDLIQEDFPSTPSAVYSTQKFDESKSPQTHPPDETDELDDVLTGIDQTTLAMQELYVADHEQHSPNGTSQTFNSQENQISRQGQKQQTVPPPNSHFSGQQNHNNHFRPHGQNNQQHFNGYGYQQGGGPSMGMYPPFQMGQQHGMGMEGFGVGQMQPQGPQGMTAGMGYGGMDGTALGLGGQPHQHQSAGFFMGQSQQGQGYVDPYYSMGGNPPQGSGFVGQMPGMPQGMPELAYSNSNTGGDGMNFMHYPQQQGQMMSPPTPYWAPQHQQQGQHHGGGMMYPPHFNQQQAGHMMGPPQHQGGRGYGHNSMRPGQHQGGMSAMHRQGKGMSKGIPDGFAPSRDQGGMDGQGHGRRTGGRGHQGRGVSTGNHAQPPAVKDPVVEDFRNTYGKGRQWEIKDLVGHVVPFCQDQHGSRFIQQRLEVASDAEKQIVFDEVLPSANSLMTDVFGNYVIQKLFEFGTPEQCETLASLLAGQAIPLALQMYGCRVIQKALEYVLIPRLITLVGEFEGQQVLRCVHDQNGNHVIQKCIEVVSRVAKESPPDMTEYLSSHIEFIIQSFKGRVKELSMHPYGCRVVQRILEHCTDAQKSPVLKELRECCRELIQDQYGNYVIQHVMQHGWKEDREILIQEVQSRLLDYSQHKFASNVVEKCIQFADKHDRDEMIWAIINVTFDLNNPVDAKTGQCVLENMVRDPYANYVVQKVIDVSNEAQRGAIILYVRENIVQLRRYTYGKHIIVRLEKVSGEKF
mmetsp:Transcript_3222/g.5001  ORF Transcript_3222/g.5001 Transcript_3222/m.5001 type:complete len:846 (+) Transcript_3222:110-2647(+)|eukprot:CAMPEP_0185029564 /NCGR_PEP_ID=MMETSP1103-20130426/15938_1 /TAXON_ID=36769 /ORGANISM="Paraphysomonas bandaiensis, Strain Caron Lab Isolate" /LENGTH=845 /DNA_ID=CAMNT_0027564363 /DNA_START=38 /DNA_END=2575 /DNA_ORIENTATION=-